MKAADARNLMNGAGIDEQIASIEASIKTAASAGKNHIFYYQQLSNDAREKLADNGFVLGATEYDQRENGYLTKISW